MSRCDTVIVNFNAGPFLKDAVESALHSPVVASVCVVDNASSDGSLDLLPSGLDSRLTIIRSATNLGFATACNIGIMQGKCENVLLLNPDCRVSPGTIERLAAVLRAAERAGMTGPVLLNPDGSEQAGGRRKLPTPALVVASMMASMGLRRLGSFATAKYLLHKEALPAEPVEVEAISGACMMVRREAIAEVGRLDERYFMHCEDLDWCMRFRQGGWRILFVPNASVVHEKGVSSRSRPLTVEYHKHRGMIRFYRTLLGQSYPRWLMGLVIAGIWTRFSGIVARHVACGGAERIWTVFRSGS